MRLDSARFITHSSNALAGVSGEMLFTGIADIDFSKSNHLPLTPFFSLDRTTTDI